MNIENGDVSNFNTETKVIKEAKNILWVYFELTPASEDLLYSK